MKIILRFFHLFLAISCVQTGASLAASAWFRQNMGPQGSPCCGASISHANTVMAMGVTGAMIQTADGGTTWAAQRIMGETANTFGGDPFADAADGAAVGVRGNNSAATILTFQTLKPG